jgi:Domain of unknown function (DUF4391)
MTEEAGIQAIFDALGLPPEARVDARVPKKLLVEQGAPTPADKRAIQDGIDELHWLAVCKPTTIGVPAFADDAREYLEIAVVSCVFRPGAKAARLIELIHRAIPYPVLLINSDVDGLCVSVAHKRHAQNEAGRVIIESVVSVAGLKGDTPDSPECAFMQSIALAQQPRRDLFTLYNGWLARIEALSAARLSGSFVVADESTSIERRREALKRHLRLASEVKTLRAKAKSEKRINRKVDLNIEIQRVETQIDLTLKDMSLEPS